MPTLTSNYSVVLNAEAISCLSSVRVERHKQVVTAGGYVTWQGASTECSQHCRRIICSIIHFENIIAASHVELEECQLNFLQMNQMKYMVCIGVLFVFCRLSAISLIGPCWPAIVQMYTV